MNINTSRTNHINVLDDLRGIAILTVVFYHYFFVYFRNKDIDNIFISYYFNFNDYLNFGVYGVSLFFLVSGFVIPMSLKGDNNLKTIYNFTIKRFFRLYPTYWFAIILITSIVILLKDTNTYTIKQILVNFTMFQDILREKHVDGVFWTLMIELKFYILTAILFYFGFLNKIKAIINVFLVLSLLTLVLGFLHDRGYGNNIISYLMLMYLGTAFYLYNKEIIAKKLLTYFIIIEIAYFSISHLFAKSSSYGEPIGYSIAVLLAIFTFIIFINYKKSISKFTTFYGNISYSLYLIHQGLGYLLIDLLFDSLVSQLVVFILFTIASYFIFVFIEKPTNKLGQKYVR